MKRTIAVILSILIILSLFSINASSPPTENNTEQNNITIHTEPIKNYPKIKESNPLPSPSQTEPPSSGDWNIYDTTTINDREIILDGNLTVHSGGNLTFHNVTLKMNCTFDGQYHIEVLTGGSFYIYDNDDDNTTTEDASVITAYNSDYEYLFWVREDSNFTMKNSELHECGWDFNSKGLSLYSDNIVIDHANISNNYFGIFADHSNATITNNTITINGMYGLWFRNSNLVICNNTFISTGDAIQFQDSSPVIINNIISDNEEGIVSIGEISNPKIINNTLISNDIGIDAFDGNLAVIDTTIKGCQRGVFGSGGSYYTIINSTIEESIYDFSLGGATIVSLNTSFSKIKIDFITGDSYLIVKRYLDVHVSDVDGKPISYAEVKIQDNENGTFNQTNVTDSNGYVKWLVLTEYEETSSDKTNYTPHNITVTKDGYLTNYAEVIMNKSKTITITLERTPLVVDDTQNHNSQALISGDLIVEVAAFLTLEKIAITCNDVYIYGTAQFNFIAMSCRDVYVYGTLIIDFSAITCRSITIENGGVLTISNSLIIVNN